MFERSSPIEAKPFTRLIAFFDEYGDNSLTKIGPDFPLFVLAMVEVERGA
jgi:hypothetical protein